MAVNEAKKDGEKTAKTCWKINEKMPEKNKNFLMFFLYSHIAAKGILYGYSGKTFFIS